MSVRTLYIAGAFAAVLIGAGIYASGARDSAPHEGNGAVAEKIVWVAGRAVRVAIADTVAERAKGLGGRAALAPDQGMLFIFPRDGAYEFWMKDMHFPIDILWLSADGTIVSMAQDVAPETFPQSFGPDKPARYVLELGAGYAEAYIVKVGDRVRL